MYKFRRYVYGVDQVRMLEYLAEARGKDESDTYYGMVRDATIVSIIQIYLTDPTTQTVGNDWLVYGVYMEHFGL